MILSAVLETRKEGFQHACVLKREISLVSGVGFSMTTVGVVIYPISNSIISISISISNSIISITVSSIGISISNPDAFNGGKYHVSS